MKKLLILPLTLTHLIAYEMITFPQMTFPLGMNASGTAVVGTNLNNQAVVWSISNGAIVIGDGEFWGISENGEVVGSLINNSSGKEEAVIWKDGETTFLGNIENGNSCDIFYSSGLGISSDGTKAVGMGWKDCQVEAFTWDPSEGMAGLGQLNGNNTKAQAVSGNGANIGGWAENNSGSRQSCIWGSDGNINLIGSISPFSTIGEVTSFSNDGSIIIGFGASVGDNDIEAYIAQEVPPGLGVYEFTPLGVPSNFATFNESMALDISENNVVVGQYLYSWMTDWRASIWTEELGTMTDLGDYFDSLGIEDLSGWTFLQAQCISDDGTVIAGTAENSMGNWVTFVIDLSEELNPTILGDLNYDSNVNVIDVILLVNHILSPSTYEYEGADINDDEYVDILDIIALVNIIINN